MNYFLNSLLYIAIATLLVQNHLFIALLFACVFTYRVSAVWLIPLGFFVDGYLGAFYEVPLFSIVSICWYAITELLRPRLMIQASYE